jgi:hypothetical protein
VRRTPNPLPLTPNDYALGWNGLNDLNFLIEKLMVPPKKVTL